MELAALQQRMQTLETQVQLIMDARSTPAASAAQDRSSINSNSFNSTTINNVTNNNTTININAFGKEDIGHLAHEDIKKFVTRDLHAALQEMIKLIHYDPSHPENMNVYMSSNGGHITWKTNAGWQKTDDVRDAANMIMRHSASHLNEHIDEPYAREYSEMQHARFEKWFQNIFVDPATSRETIAMTMDTVKAKSPVVEAMHMENAAPHIALHTAEPR